MPHPVSGQDYLDQANTLALQYETLLAASSASDWVKLDSGLPEISAAFSKLQACEGTLMPSEHRQARELFARILELDRLLQEAIRVRMADLATLLPSEQ